jgi:hypothetical protein
MMIGTSCLQWHPDLQEMNRMLSERVKTWTEEWKREGFAESIPRGEAKLLRRLVMGRFGDVQPCVDARLDGATKTELETWGEGLLDASSIEAVFVEPRRCGEGIGWRHGVRPLSRAATLAAP